MDGRDKPGHDEKIKGRMMDSLSPENPPILDARALLERALP